MNRKGFTMVELVLVIAILGILAVSALPRFLDLSTDAHESARDGVVGAVRSGIALYRANNMVSGGSGAAPAVLDSMAGTGDCVNCFADILTNGINADGWEKAAANNYTFVGGGATDSYLYNVTNGTFQ